MNEQISYSNKNLMPLVFSFATGCLFFATWLVFAIVPMHRAGVRLSAWKIPDELIIPMLYQ